MKGICYHRVAALQARGDVLGVRSNGLKVANAAGARLVAPHENPPFQIDERSEIDSIKFPIPVH
jgi:hypothetical protein